MRKNLKRIEKVNTEIRTCIGGLLMKEKKLISYFLIIFGLIGYAISLPLTYYSASFLNTVSVSLEAADNGLVYAKNLVNETGVTLANVSSNLNETVLTLSSLNVSSILSPAEKSLNQIADMLESMSNNVLLKIGASSAASDAGKAAVSIRNIANNLTEISSSTNSTLANFENSMQEVNRLLENYEDSIVNIESTLNIWIIRVQSIRESFWVVQFGVYGFIIYLLLLHTAFLLIGLHFLRSTNQIQDVTLGNNDEKLHD
jgi:prefoldin subunit 5